MKVSGFCHLPSAIPLSGFKWKLLSELEVQHHYQTIRTLDMEITCYLHALDGQQEDLGHGKLSSIFPSSTKRSCCSWYISCELCWWRNHKRHHQRLSDLQIGKDLKPTMHMPKPSEYQPHSPVPWRAGRGECGRTCLGGDVRPHLSHHGTSLPKQKGRQGAAYPRCFPHPQQPKCSHGMRPNFAGWWLLPWDSIIHTCF